MSSNQPPSETSLLAAGFNMPRLLLLVFAALMIAVSLYLTDHFYELQFPKSLSSSSICDVSNFWNCDVATLSPLSQIYGIPLSVFGIIIGLCFLVGAFISHRGLEKTNHTLAIVNLLACLGLFTYSLVALGGLCPGCTLYYACSLGVFILYQWKSAGRPQLALSVLLSYGLLAAAISGGFYYYSRSEEAKIDKVASRFLLEFRKSPNFEVFNLESPFRLASATTNFPEAPLRISLFSDFQCPVCKVLAEDILPKLLRHYRGKMNLQYFFYPMDSNCNHNVSQPMHPLACEAAYVAYCAGKQFPEAHDLLYAKQNELSNTLLQKLAVEYEVTACYNDQKTKDQVEDMILAGDKVGVQATPTMIVNGRKLEGLLPLKFLIILFDDILNSKAEN